MRTSMAGEWIVSTCEAYHPVGRGPVQNDGWVILNVEPTIWRVDPVEEDEDEYDGEDVNG